MPFMPPPPQTQVLETQVPETEVPEPQVRRKRSHKKKVVAYQTPTEMQDRKKWEDDEEAELAQAWIDSSEDSVLSDGKRTVIFWAEIRDKFFEIMGRGRYRGDVSVYNKWKAMALKMNHFSTIHTRLTNNKPSGTNDADLLKAMLKQYKGLHGHHFSVGMFEIWKKCTSSPKWHPIPTSSP
ncbi:uncharacterized protein LOC143548124 [Bidens hawaiensis]|uniref:uncharacterized protein LOC143548124 n=1 Tax=Bidens hawaiensis TaxID=980011 RepID=UPI00404A5358